MISAEENRSEPEEGLGEAGPSECCGRCGEGLRVAERESGWDSVL